MDYSEEFLWDAPGEGSFLATTPLQGTHEHPVRAQVVCASGGNSWLYRYLVWMHWCMFQSLKVHGGEKGCWMMIA